MALLFSYTQKQINDYYNNLFQQLNGITTQGYIAYIKKILSDLSHCLNIDINELDKDLQDPVLLKTNIFGPIESLKRIYTTLAEAAAYRATMDPDWSLLAGRIEIMRLKILVPENLEQVYEKCENIYNKDYLEFCKTHCHNLEKMIIPERDFDFHYFGVKTLEKSYLLMSNGQYLETPQRMYLRVASYLWMPDIEAIKEYYDLLSRGYFTHASPTLFNSGIKKGNLASCFLLSMQDDLSKIFDCLNKCAQISKSAGGIGLDVSSIRHSKIGHYGDSSGIVPMLKVYDAAMKYVNQCFSPDTLILTKNGYKRIDKIVPGDKVIDLTGNYKKVAKTIHYPYVNNENNNLVSIKLVTNPDFTIVAGGHPILAIKSGLKLLDNIKNNLITATFIEANKLEIGDLIVFPRIKYSNDIKDYTNDDLKIYTKLIKRGLVEKNGFSLIVTEEEFKHVFEYLKLKNIAPNITFSDNATIVKWETGSGFPFNTNIITDPFTSDIMNLPKEKIQVIINEFFNNQTSEQNSFILNINLNTAIILQNLLQKLDLFYTIKETKSENNTSFLFTKINVINYMNNDHYLLPIEKIQPTIEFKHSKIIELEMVDQTNPNYLTPIGIAHNGGRRKGSATIFLNPAHIDILDFISLKRAQGVEERRARDLFYSCWIPDIFMQRVKNNESWSLFCPKKAILLTQTHGTDFDIAYKKYEQMGIYEKQLPARTIWNELLDTQIETGMPFMTYSDTANATSNQKNLGLLRSSNLCQEIIEITGPSIDSRKDFKKLTGHDLENWWENNSEDRISSCNLASIALDEYVYIDPVDNKPKFDFALLGSHVKKLTQGLNRVIDKTCYPLCTIDNQGNNIDGPIKTTNLKYRPLGIGVQGLADTFFKMDYAWSDPEAKQLNKDIFATIYYYSLEESIEQAKIYGYYQSFEDSPSNKGLLKFDLVANEIYRKYSKDSESIALNKRYEILSSVSKMYDWNALKEKIKLYGLRNSLLIALMPTASTAQIRYKTEAFEPMTSNIYVRSVLSGNHIFINRYLTKKLKQLNLWTPDIINFIISKDGSIQDIPDQGYPQLNRIKEIFKTAFELKQKILVDMAIDRSLYVCQSQSLNIFIKNPNYANLTSLHFYGWENCLTTGMYYLRSAPATEAIKFTIDTNFTLKSNSSKSDKIICTDDVCVMCSS